MKKRLLTFAFTLLFLSPLSGWAALSTSLISYWPLNEASGNALDSTASANTLTDTATVTSNPGKVYATARQFTAANSEYFTKADNASLSVGGTSFSLVVWVYFDSTGTRWIISKDDTGTNREFNLFYNGSQFEIDTWTASGGVGLVQRVASTFGAVSTATWYMVAVVCDQATSKISVNAGTQDSSAAVNAGWNGAAPFVIGARQSASFMDGRIGPVIFWKKALTSQEITDVYNNGAGLTNEGVLGTGIIMHPLTSGGSTTDGTGFTTASITPTATSQVFVAVASSFASGPASPTVVGNGITYNAVRAANFFTAGTPLERISLFQGSAASPSAGTVVITFGATRTGCLWSIFEMTGSSGTIVQQNTGLGASGTTASVSLAAFGDATNNVAIGVTGVSVNSSVTPGTGLVEIHDVTIGTPTLVLETLWRTGQDTTLDSTFSGSADWAMMGFELALTDPSSAAPLFLLSVNQD